MESVTSYQALILCVTPKRSERETPWNGLPHAEFLLKPFFPPVHMLPKWAPTQAFDGIPQDPSNPQQSSGSSRWAPPGAAPFITDEPQWPREGSREGSGPVTSGWGWTKLRGAVIFKYSRAVPANRQGPDCSEALTGARAETAGDSPRSGAALYAAVRARRLTHRV